jgi:hypothetical protein
VQTDEPSWSAGVAARLRSRSSLWALRAASSRTELALASWPASSLSNQTHGVYCRPNAWL